MYAPGPPQVLLDYAVPDPAIDLYGLASSASLEIVEPLVVQIYETQVEETPSSPPPKPPRTPRPITIPPPAPSTAAANVQVILWDTSPDSPDSPAYQQFGSDYADDDPASPPG